MEGGEDDSVLSNWRYQSLNQKELQIQESGSTNN